MAGIKIPGLTQAMYVKITYCLNQGSYVARFKFIRWANYKKHVMLRTQQVLAVF